jgi:ABC-type dipeptide/oligopeptide/nickel transport system permease component
MALALLILAALIVSFFVGIWCGVSAAIRAADRYSSSTTAQPLTLEMFIEHDRGNDEKPTIH